MTQQYIKLSGRVFFEFSIRAMTGLHIGGSDTGIEIGGVDNTVIRDVLTNQPYIPGSSLKGKMRSLLEKFEGKKKNYPRNLRTFHVCEDENEYQTCDVCQVFGVPGEKAFGLPTRLIVRDVFLTETSIAELEGHARTDLPFTEVKTEVSIDRVTSAANPRPLERVPAGSVFGPAELVFNIFSNDSMKPSDDVDRLEAVVKSLQLLEDDYLGGSGSRGSGKVTLQDIKVFVRGKDYLADKKLVGKYDDLNGLAANLSELKEKIQAHL